jgi:hypothetical protein
VRASFLNVRKRGLKGKEKSRDNKEYPIDNKYNKRSNDKDKEHVVNKARGVHVKKKTVSTRAQIKRLFNHLYI